MSFEVGHYGVGTPARGSGRSHPSGGPGEAGNPVEREIMKLKFKAKKGESADQLVVSYSCDCGCKPEARYERNADEGGHEHCCCGKVHFAGPRAEQELRDYLGDRRKNGQDEGLGFDLSLDAVKAPWGETVPVAYALPYAEADRAGAG